MLEIHSCSKDRIANAGGIKATYVLFFPVKGDRCLQEQQESFCSAYEELDFHAGDAKRLPPCLLYSSKADLTVPW